MDCFIVELNTRKKIAIPLTQIQEVISIKGNNICPIPGVKRNLLGMINLNGNLLWILDLSLLLENSYTLASQLNSGKVIIANIGQSKIGLMASRLRQIKDFDLLNINDTSLPKDDYYLGFGQEENESIPIIDLSKIQAYLL